VAKELVSPSLNPNLSCGKDLKKHSKIRRKVSLRRFPELVARADEV